MSVVALMAPIAARQHALAHLDQLREVGLTDDAIARAVHLGEIERRLPEIYAFAGSPRTWRQDLMAATLDAGPNSAVSHRAAAIVIGIARRGAPEIVEISVPRPLNSRMRGVIVHRSRDLCDEHVVTVDGFRCTGPLRTLLDLGAVEPWWEVADSLERGLQSGAACSDRCSTRGL